jgi:hypothetical protein
MSQKPIWRSHYNDLAQAGNTLYCLSHYALSSKSNFWASMPPLDEHGAIDGQTDDHPIIIPSQITAAHIDVFLSHEVQCVCLNSPVSTTCGTDISNAILKV